MPKEIDPKRPVVRGRASVIHTDLTVTVYWKEQLKPAMDWCIEHDVEFEWEIRKGDSLVPDEFDLTIYNVCWANNLTDLAKVLETCDYMHEDFKD